MITIIGFVMNKSYKLWFMVLGITLFVLLMTVYLVLIKEKKSQ